MWEKLAIASTPTIHSLSRNAAAFRPPSPSDPQNRNAAAKCITTRRDKVLFSWVCSSLMVMDRTTISSPSFSSENVDKN